MISTQREESRSARHYQRKYAEELDIEARMFRLGAAPKADSVEMLTRELSRPFSSLAEIGCGTGAVLEELARRGLAQSYFAVDGSSDALTHVQHALGNKVTTFQADLEKDSLPVKVDVALLCHVLEHLEDPSVLLRALTRQCTYLVAEVPLENQPLTFLLDNVRSKVQGRPRAANPAGHVQFFTRSSFRSLLQRSGWEILRERRYLPRLLPYARALALAHIADSARLRRLPGQGRGG